MQYVGLDVHSKYTKIQHMDAHGNLGYSESVATEPSSLGAFFEQLDEEASVTLEAGRSWWWISQFLKDHPRVAEVKVLDPRRSRKIAEELSVFCGYGRAKNDRIDAEMMAEEDRHGLAPAIRIPTCQQLIQRTFVRYRFELVGQRTAVWCQLKALLSFHGVQLSIPDLIEDRESQLPYLDSLPDMLQFIVFEWIERLLFYQQQIQRCEEKIEKLLPESHPLIKLLMTVPGIGIVMARMIVCEILSIEYFKEPRYLISYSCLAPVEHESAGRKGLIKLNRHGNHYLKYAFMTAAHAARTHPKYRRKYEHDVKKHGKTRAKINLARKIAKTVYWMLTRQQPFSG